MGNGTPSRHSDRPQGVVTVGSRVGRMIQWLRDNEAKVMRSKKGRVQFDYKDSIITARHEDVQEKI